MKGFTKCPNGHYYKEELAYCPYCQTGNKSAGNVDPKDKTQLYTESKEENKTRLVIPKLSSDESSNRTVFGKEVTDEIEGKTIVKTDYRNERKLVGWIVSYSFNEMGADFRLFEGRNVIGRDAGNNITVPDKMMSGKHATILFKNDKFKITDELSSHGTWVNGSDIEDEHVELHDNDLIRMGETVFKFKVAL